MTTLLWHHAPLKLGGSTMMALIFAALSLAMVAAYAGRGRLATVAILSCLLLSIGEFLWVIYSSEYGFRMPWIQVHAIDAPARS